MSTPYTIIFLTIYFTFVITLVLICFVLSDDHPLSILCIRTLPKILLSPFPPSLRNKLLGSYDWIVNKPNPLMQITYLSIVTSAYYTMLTSGYPLIPNPYMRSWHKDFGYVVFGICYWTFYKACTVSPGDLREETVERYDNYSYDNVLYIERVCETTKFRKIARSKYDRTVGRSTNEFFKWRDIQGWHKRARRRYDNTSEEDRGPRFDISKAEYEMVGVDLNKDVGCVSVTSSTTSSSKNSEKEEALNDDEKEEADESNVQDPGPFPKNIYDRGVWGNFGEVIWPRSLRESGGETKQKKTHGGGGSKKKKKKKKN
ncbi:hypothetical protein TrLO_g6700 [Triparma laevis f. longispina]|uniref:Uncharacterized protein n=1 Tax=Triparma laevis f. longispina TaxID=1714387 RepID=A0A9W7CD12_9STRA|nr:hypothetical protein TrLO_g6700 [Triparma laevis f. longispina]